LAVAALDGKLIRIEAQAGSNLATFNLFEGVDMKCPNSVITVAVLTLLLGAMQAHALEPSIPLCTDPGSGCEAGGRGGPGPGDRSLDPLPLPGKDDKDNENRSERADKKAEAAELKRQQQKEADKNKVKSIGRRPSSGPATPQPHRTICEAARDSRARNSPVAPDLEAQCRARGG
jgi:hypothetical protein